MDTQLDAELRANILVEALPYIQEYYGQTVVVKYGGNAMINEELKDAVIHDLVLLNLVGVKVVIVHGGGRRSMKCWERSARRASSSTVCATPIVKPWISSRWCCAARSTRIL